MTATDRRFPFHPRLRFSNSAQWYCRYRRDFSRSNGVRKRMSLRIPSARSVPPSTARLRRIRPSASNVMRKASKSASSATLRRNPLQGSSFSSSEHTAHGLMWLATRHSRHRSRRRKLGAVPPGIPGENLLPSGLPDSCQLFGRRILSALPIFTSELRDIRRFVPAVHDCRCCCLPNRDQISPVSGIDLTVHNVVISNAAPCQHTAQYHFRFHSRPFFRFPSLPPTGGVPRFLVDAHPSFGILRILFQPNGRFFRFKNCRHLSRSKKNQNSVVCLWISLPLADSPIPCPSRQTFSRAPPKIPCRPEETSPVAGAVPLRP